MAPPKKKQRVSVETPVVAPDSVTSGDNNNEPQLEDEASVAAMVKIITERMFEDDLEEVAKSLDQVYDMVGWPAVQFCVARVTYGNFRSLTAATLTLNAVSQVVDASSQVFIN